MALFVTGVGSLIHLYSIGYMHGDLRYSTFFVLLNLFLFSMLCLVLADNFLFSFLGWEGVGFCSYQLVSFWFERNRAAVAGKKAFVTNRVGDFGFMIGMFLIFDHFGSLNYADVFKSLTGAPGALASVTATGIALMLFLGAAGKSAQLPLYIWLPDAMEGPTPVSALIHAATMVTAGVYLMARIAPILHYAPDALTTIAVVGAVTALFAATIACAQDDIKKVLAYSTISQLGYMFLGIGSGGYVAGLFHMVTHAFFKALLFLCAGSVIHGMHDEQDMKKMGALRRWMPITFVTFLIGWLAISGIPPLRRLLVQGRHPGRGLAQEPGPVGRRLRHRRPDRLLHEPPGRPGLVRPGPLGGRGPSGRGATRSAGQAGVDHRARAGGRATPPSAAAHGRTGGPRRHGVEPHESPWTDDHAAGRPGPAVGRRRAAQPAVRQARPPRSGGSSPSSRPPSPPTRTSTPASRSSSAWR